MPLKTPLNIITQLTNQLSFDHFNAAIEGSKHIDAIAHAEQIINAEDKIPQVELAPLYEKIGIWYLFYKRDKDNALRYLNIYEALFKSDEEKKSLQYGMLLNLIGHAYTIDGSLEEKVYFEDALKIFNASSAKTKHIQLEMAFAERYIGLYYHRKSDNKTAQDYFSRAASKFAEHAGEMPDINLAECWHLLGVSYTREKRFVDAREQLQKAYQMEMDYCAVNGYHFLLFITMQSLADANRKLAEEARAKNKNAPEITLFHEGKQLLQEALRQQIKFYGTEINADIAKTLQFLGENHFSQSEYVLATQNFLKALSVKRALYHDDKHQLIQYSHDALASLLKQIQHEFNFDWNNPATFAGNKFKVPMLDNVLSQLMPHADTLRSDCKEIFAELCVTLSSFYNHVERKPARALFFQQAAYQTQSLAGEKFAWMLNHLAYSLQQIQFQAKSDATLLKEPILLGIAKTLFNDATLAQLANTFTLVDVYYMASHYLQYAREETKELKNIEAIKITGFSYCLEGLVQYENGQLDYAVVSYKKALTLYEDNHLLDDQYARAKLRYTQMLCEQRKPLEDPKKIFSELETYWKGKPDNIYGARMYDGYAKYHLQQSNPSEALAKWKEAYAIMIKCEGKESGFSKEIFSHIVEMEKTLQNALSPRARSQFALYQPAVPPKVEVKELPKMHNN